MTVEKYGNLSIINILYAFSVCPRIGKHFLLILTIKYFLHQTESYKSYLTSNKLRLLFTELPSVKSFIQRAYNKQWTVFPLLFVIRHINNARVQAMITIIYKAHMKRPKSHYKTREELWARKVQI